jgi:hypothetical protein
MIIGYTSINQENNQMTEYVIHEEQYKGLTIKIVPDGESENPRTWDNLAKMACWHKRYNLGDPNSESPEEFIRHTPKKKFIILPLYLYDHSGITISTSHQYPYNDRWDAGQVGWIYISKKYAVKNFGKVRFTKAVEQKALECLEAEVQVYDDYLRGDAYGYKVCDEDGNVLDSCWGFYPDHDSKPEYAYCLEEAKSVANAHAVEAGVLV